MEEKLWYKSYAPEVKKTLEYEKVTIPEALTRTAKRFPEKVSLNYMGRKITYKELDGLVNRFAKALSDLGVKEGDKVAMILPNIPEVIIANLSTYRIGAVVVLNNPLYTERELEYQLNDSDSKLVVTISLLVQRIQKIQPKTKVEKVIACQINTFLPFPKKQLFPYVKKQMYKKIETSDRVLMFDELIKKYSDAPLENKSKWDELSTLIYTGGTTGLSKGVMLSVPFHKYAGIRTPLHPLPLRSAPSPYCKSTPQSRALPERRTDVLDTSPYL